MKRKDNNGAGVSTLAQSEEVGLLLVFSITITSMGVILMMGVPTLNDAKENAQIQRVETEFGSLDRQISSAAFGGGQTQARVNIQQGDFSFEPDAGWINISYYNGSETIWENKSLPAITYTHVDSMISYQGGGIWTKYGDGSTTMVSPPDINLRGNTLNIALINITSGGFQTAGGRDLFTFTHNGNHRMDAFSDLGPLNVGSLNLTIRSQHYRGWARYFNETGWPDVKVYSSNNTVIAKNPTGSPPFSQAILSSGNRVIVDDSNVDSYDSRIGNYSDETKLSAADIESRQNVDIKGTSIINGTVETGGKISCMGCGGSIITGDVFAELTGSADFPPDIHGTEFENADVTVNVHAPIETTIEDAITEFSTPLPSCTPASPCGSGDYIVSGDRTITQNWVFDTSNGPIRIALNNNNFRIQSDELRIRGDNPVIIFRGETNSNKAFRMEGVEMVVEDNRTDLFQVYAHPSPPQTKVLLTDSSDPTKFYGVIYAPFNKNVDVVNSVVFGSVIGQEAELDGSELHYDHSLTELELPAIGATRISYLHATDNRVGAR